MKKSKSFKLRTSLSVLATTTPIVAGACLTTGCSSSLKNIGDFTWNPGSNYTTLMTNDEIINVFKDSNKTLKDGGTLPDDIYDNISLEVRSRQNVLNYSILIKALESSDLYKGKKTVQISVKNDVSLIKWEKSGYYPYQMDDDKVLEEFKKNNPPGKRIPSDIYDNVDLDVKNNGVTWTITITALPTSQDYAGVANVEVSALIDVALLNWSTHGAYNVAMSNEEIIEAFKEMNKPGQGDLPLNVYDNVDVTNNGSSKWIITIKAKDKSKTYFGKTEKTVSYSNSMTYDGKDYYIDTDIDPNLFITCDDSGYLTQEIPLMGAGSVTIGGSAKDWNKLTNLNISEFDNSVTTIGNNFLKDCTKLTKLYLPLFNNITNIEDNFLRGCTSLTNVDLTPLNKLKVVGRYFLAHCSGLNSINICGLNSLNTIGNNFMYSSGNDELTSLDFTGCNSITSIADTFLANIRNLQTINFGSIRGNVFASDNSSLSAATREFGAYTKGIFIKGDNYKSIIEKFPNSKYFGSLDAYRNIYCKDDNTFVYDNQNYVLNTTVTPNAFCTADNIDPGRVFRSCEIALITNENVNIKGKKDDPGDWSKITECIWRTDQSSLEIIGDQFLYTCGNLEKLDLSCFNNLKSIGSNFLRDCTELEQIVLPELTNKLLIADNFLFDCFQLGELNIPNSWDVTQIGIHFLANCISITTLNLHCLRNITSFPYRSLYNCAALHDLYFDKTNKLEEIGQEFLYNATVLETFDMSVFPHLKTIGNGFMGQCFALKTLDMRALTELTNPVGGCAIGSRFLELCWLTDAEIWLPLKDPKTYNTSGDDFFYCTIFKCFHAGPYVDLYKQTPPWDKYAGSIIE